MIKRRKYIVPFILSIFIVIFVCPGATNDKPEKTEPEKCAECHKDSRAYREWEKSGHFESLRNFKKASDATKSCLKCHSADHSALLVSPWISPDKLPDLESASNSISCSACHRHDSGIEHNLVMPAEKLCVACHVHFCGG